MTESTPSVDVMTRRRDFVAASRARKAATGTLILQSRQRKDGSDLIRVGFTASKKVGNAVARNRAKRRMRALVRELLPQNGVPGHDYVLIARKDQTTEVDFSILRQDLARALERVQTTRKP